MCGRFCQTIPPEILAEHFQIECDDIPSIIPSYNIAPTHISNSIIYMGKKRQIKPMRWGLIPSWAETINIGAKLINARCETIDEKPAFKQAFYHRRCLIPANGFYEWKKIGKNKQPYFFGLIDNHPFAFAGIWEYHQNKTLGNILSYAIITTHPNDIVEPVHHRMPVILMPEDYDLWLNGSLKCVTDVKQLLKPFPSEQMIAYHVSAFVNSPNNNSPKCIQKVETPIQRSLL